MADETRKLGVEPFKTDFDSRRHALPGNDVSWMGDLRQANMARFAGLGLPTNRVEAWKYTSLRPLARKRFVPAPANLDLPGRDALPAPIEDGIRLVFANGRFAPGLSDVADLPAGVRVRSLAEVLAREPDDLHDRLAAGGPADHPLFALNTALMEDGLVVDVDDGARLKMPLDVVFAAQPMDAVVALHPRNVVRLGDGAEATLVERHIAVGDGEYLVNGGCQISLGTGARLHHYKLQDEGEDATHLFMTEVDAAESAVYDGFVMTVGGRLSRNQISASLDGSHANVRLNGAYALRGRQHADHTSLIEHVAPDARSRQIYHGAIDERARGVFQGQIVVRQAAQKTDGHQLNRALLLSDEAEIDSKPMLEIYADDVKCSHGATTGDLDDTALFYLRSRGIPPAEARGLLIAAFLNEVIAEIDVERLRPLFEARVAEWLARGRGGA